LASSGAKDGATGQGHIETRLARHIKGIQAIQYGIRILRTETARAKPNAGGEDEQGNVRLRVLALCPVVIVLEHPCRL
jgi:hypothetical protein